MPKLASDKQIVEALGALRIAVAFFDENDILVDCNEQYRYTCRSFDKLENVIGLSFTELLQWKLDNGEIAGKKAIDDPDGWIKDRVERRMNPQWGPVETQLTDGRWIQINERVLPEGGTIGLYTDVTASKKTDIRLHDMIEEKSNAFALWDQRDKLILRNAEFESLFDINGHGVPPGISYLELMSNAAAAHFYLAGEETGVWLAKRAQMHRAPKNQEIFQHRDGRWVMITERRTRDGGIATLCSDVTDVKEKELALVERGVSLTRVVQELEMSKTVLEHHSTDLVYMLEELSVANAQMEAANESKAHFLSMVSHELRTPMNAIIGFSEIIKNEMLGEIENKKYIDYAADINAGAEHLLTLINGLLDMSKIESGKYDVQFGTLDLESEARMCIRMVEKQCDAKNISIDLRISAEARRIQGDLKSIRQILLNLLSNASKFTREFGNIEVSARAKGDRVTICVADNGIGIPEIEIPRIMMPFEQLENDLCRTHEGTGLGLALCKSLVELHGGALEIVSAEGIGTTVSFDVPAAETPDGDVLTFERKAS